jgi:hypothetical protein
MLDKVKIIAFTTPDFELGGFPVGIYLAMFNPESFSVEHRVNYDKTTAPGRIGTESKFRNVEAQTVSFNFLIDGTGASGEKREVFADIELFKYVVGYFGEIHRPHYLILQWGTFLMKCVLESMTIKYELFRPDGTPLRAAISASFSAFTAGLLETLLAGRSSPDLSHVRIVKEGDTLPLMSYRIYGDASLYIEVARVNKLNDFRNLKPGDRLIFPPIKDRNK